MRTPDHHGPVGVVRLPKPNQGTAKVAATYGGNATTRASSAQASIPVGQPTKEAVRLRSR